MLSVKDITYAKAIFEYNKGVNEFPLVNNVMRNRNLLTMYFNQENVTSFNSVYDYMLWLRKLRKFLYPECNYKIKRRKTPKCEHNFRDMPIYEYYNKGC